MSKTYRAINIICILLGLITLTGSRALFAPYLLFSLFSLYCLANENATSVKEHTVAVNVMSAISAFFILIANYQIWLFPLLPDNRTPMFVRSQKAALVLMIFAGSYFAVRNILTFIADDSRIRISFDGGSIESSDKAPASPALSFTLPFILILLSYLTVYFLSYYPGLMSLDSIDQIDQIFTGRYSNHQPFYHTLMIGAFLRAGLLMFGDINAAAAFYVIVQAAFLAAVFAFSVRTMADLALPKWSRAAALIWYMVMPFHIMFSFTVWKDVYFGAFTALLIIFFARICRGIGRRSVNIAGFAVCAPFICLLRSNGLFAYVFVFAAMLLLMRKQTKLIAIMAAMIVAAFILKHPVLGALDVTQPDTVESLSIPLQQISRVITDKGHIADDDRAFLAQFMDIDAIKDTYNPDISDPVKNMIRDLGNERYLTDNIGTFLAVYCRTFIKNPMTYIIAWVDSTCGYWNSGYNYWVWYWDIEDNGYGLKQTVVSPAFRNAMDQYLWLYYNNPVLMIFTATGMYTWIVLLMFVRCCFQKNTCGIIAAVPILAIILSLVISSPVYAEFRYMYALFCALPVLCALTFSPLGAPEADKEAVIEDNMQ
ncbi:MAG: hypothetical protein IKO16_10405 [Lachnospiraceae bacterium]|nr:hypothetical protein [Lachnospiraceae bacterium]